MPQTFSGTDAAWSPQPPARAASSQVPTRVAPALRTRARFKCKTPRGTSGRHGASPVECNVQGGGGLTQVLGFSLAGGWRMGKFVAACKVDDVAEGRGHTVFVSGMSLAIFNQGGHFHAFL